MKPAVIESPFAPAPMPKAYVDFWRPFGQTEESLQATWNQDSVKRHQLYARKLCWWALHHGYAPYASHLLYAHPAVLDDRLDGERELGIKAGFVWHEKAEAAIVGLNLHMSSGMIQGIANHIVAGNEIDFVRLSDDWMQPRSQPTLKFRHVGIEVVQLAGGGLTVHHCPALNMEDILSLNVALTRILEEKEGTP